ncbi:MAG: hypothetical protein ABI835_06385 [Chloroflexota bacterium]
MVLPGDWDEDSEEARAEDREDALDEREEWLEIAEEEFIAEGDISVSETVDGHDPTPELDDQDVSDEELNATMHEEELD